MGCAGEARLETPTDTFLTLKENAVRFDKTAMQRPTDMGWLWTEDKERTAGNLMMPWVQPSPRPALPHLSQVY